MRYVRSFFFVLLLVAVVCTAVHAEPDFPADTAAGETVPVDATSTIPVVALDPDSVQAIADAVLPTEADNLDPTEATTPVVDLSPEAVASIGQAVGDALAVSDDPPVLVNSASPLSGGYFFEADCALGSGVRFYVPVDFAVDCFSMDDDGLVNMTNSTIYAMSPDFPTYTISCSRFGHFTYRRPSGSGSYNTYDLNITSIKKTNMSLIDSDPPVALPTWQYWLVMIVVVVIFGAILCFFRRH